MKAKLDESEIRDRERDLLSRELHSDLRVSFSKPVAHGDDWLAAVIQFGMLFGMTPCWSDDNHDGEIVFRFAASVPCPFCAVLEGKKPWTP
jgi:hypothetical protein